MSLAIDPGYGAAGSVSPVTIPINRLRPAERLRSGGVDEQHISRLMETIDEWPPIVVWGDDPLVVDGTHRLEAARRLGRRSLRAERFFGTREEAFVEAVRRNVNHGLPLSVSDRRRAALKVLARHTEWSDRRIALLCGLSGKTVARLRREPRAAAHDVVVGLERRIGRDGKARPVQSRQVRERIKSALEENPSGSLRAIAAMAGTSPETVRTVRARLKDGARLPPTATTMQSHRTETSGKQPKWASDPALLTCGDNGAFARWFAANRLGDEWREHVWSVPVGRIYEVVDEARRRASSWTDFASALERRTR